MLAVHMYNFSNVFINYLTLLKGVDPFQARPRPSIEGCSSSELAVGKITTRALQGIANQRPDINWSIKTPSLGNLRLESLKYRPPPLGGY